MPGQLKRTARCPKCGDDLDAIIDETSRAGVIREYFHAKGSPKARRRRRCRVAFTDFDIAGAERRGLEVKPRRIH